MVGDARFPDPVGAVLRSARPSPAAPRAPDACTRCRRREAPRPPPAPRQHPGPEPSPSRSSPAPAASPRGRETASSAERSRPAQPQGTPDQRSSPPQSKSTGTRPGRTPPRHTQSAPPSTAPTRIISLGGGAALSSAQGTQETMGNMKRQPETSACATPGSVFETPRSGTGDVGVLEHPVDPS